MTISRSVLLGALAVLALFGAGCSSSNFERLPRPGVDLSGHWVRDPAASDDGEAMIAASLPKPPPRRRPLDNFDNYGVPADSQTAGGRSGGGQPGGGQRRGSRGDSLSDSNTAFVNPPTWAKIGARDYVRAFALPPQRLEIAQRPDLMVIEQAARRRSFEPGDEAPRSFSDRFGSRSVRAGWDANEFVITSADSAHLSVREHFRALSGDRLESTVEFSGERLRSLKIHTVYRRATALELDAPPGEGPPEPGPR